MIGVTGAAAAATGIGALLVIGIGLIAVISDAIRQSVREKQARKRQCNEWRQWCSWGKDLFNHYGLLYVIFLFLITSEFYNPIGYLWSRIG